MSPREHKETRRKGRVDEKVDEGVGVKGEGEEEEERKELTLAGALTSEDGSEVVVESCILECPLLVDVG